METPAQDCPARKSLEPPGPPRRLERSLGRKARGHAGSGRETGCRSPKSLPRLAQRSAEPPGFVGTTRFPRGGPDRPPQLPSSPLRGRGSGASAAERSSGGRAALGTGLPPPPPPLVCQAPQSVRGPRHSRQAPAQRWAVWTRRRARPGPDRDAGGCAVPPAGPACVVRSLPDAPSLPPEPRPSVSLPAGPQGPAPSCRAAGSPREWGQAAGHQGPQPLQSEQEARPPSLTSQPVPGLEKRP